MLEREIAADPRLAKQLDVIARCLEPLETCRHQDAPPLGLASRTCRFVFAENANAVTPARQGVAAAMHPEYGSSDAHSRWSLADFVVAAGIFLAAGMLFFPAIANSRYQAHLAQCQNNLRQIGHAYITYSNHHDGQFPEIPKQGNLSFAGLPAVHLTNAGYLVNSNAFVCPSSPLVERRNDWSIPTQEELDNASGETLAALQARAAGSTALPLGYLEDEEYTSGRNQSRENHVLAADAPAGLAPQLMSQHHDGKGQNVVFESGRTAYIRGCGTQECGDSIYVNRLDLIGPGLDEDDNVVAVSSTRPYPELNIVPVSNMNQ